MIICGDMLLPSETTELSNDCVFVGDLRDVMKLSTLPLRRSEAWPPPTIGLKPPSTVSSIGSSGMYAASLSRSTPECLTAFTALSRRSRCGRKPMPSDSKSFSVLLARSMPVTPASNRTRA